MTQFKVGDRVRAVADGEEGIVMFASNDVTVDVKWDDSPNDAYRSYVEDIELVEDQPNRTYYETMQALQDANERDSETFKVVQAPFEQNVHRHLNKIADILISKNKQYANSALDPIRVFSKADRMEQLRVRADDKLSRIRNGDTSEDAVTDLCGYLILMKIAEESS